MLIFYEEENITVLECKELTNFDKKEQTNTPQNIKRSRYTSK